MKSLMLLYGSSDLGKALISRFAKANNYWRVLNIDSINNPQVSHLNIDWTKPITPQLESVENELQKFSDKYQCIISAGYQFTPTKFKEVEALKVMSELNSSCVLPALLASHLSTKFLDENGLLLFHGSHHVLKDKDYDAAVFGTALNMVHGISDYMANSPLLPKGAKVITAATDFAYPNEFGRKPEDVLDPEAVAEEVYMWANADKGLPENGSFIGITGNKGIVVPNVL